MQKPLIIFDKHKNTADLVFQNRKGHNKSIEQNELWCMHRQSGKVLPYSEGCKLINVAEKEKWYEAYVDFGDADSSSRQEIHTADDNNSGNRGLPDTDILEKLVSLIAVRQKEMPEGSYTTHLFNSGTDKIRKKTGEEAVELLLARDRDETVCEAADLIYHMIVLFQSLDIDFNEIFRELKTRHS